MKNHLPLASASGMKFISATWGRYQRDSHPAFGGGAAIKTEINDVNKTQNASEQFLNIFLLS